MRLIDLDDYSHTFCGHDGEYEKWNIDPDAIVPDVTVPIEPERKKGRWLPDNNNYYEERYVCSDCKRSFRVDTCMGKPSWNYCPNCGARMEED